MSSSRGAGDFQRGRGRGGDRDRGRGGDRGGGRGGTMELPFRPNESRGGSFRGGDSRGRGDGSRGRGRGDYRGGGRGDFGGRGGRGGGFRGGRGDHGPRIFSQGNRVPSPSSKVEQTETAIAKALVVKHQKSAGQARYPERPGYGTQGTPVTLYANYFELKSVGKELFRYNVDILADSARTKPTGKKARQIIRLLLDEHFLQYSNSIATDYKSTLISRVELPSQGQYDVRYKDENDDDYPEQPRVYRVDCQFTGRLNPGDLLNYLTSANSSAMFESKAEVLQAMNIVMGHHPKTDRTVASVGANKHFATHPDLTERYDLGAGLEVLRGFFVSVRAATARILVNVQVKYAACYQEGPLGNVINEYQRGNSRNIYKLEAFVKRLRIQAIHIVRKNKKGQVVPRIKTIAGLATRADGASLPHPPKVARHGAGPRDVQFFLEAPGQKSEPGSSKGKKGKKPAKAGPEAAGRYVTVADFFLQEYKKTLDPNMPVVNVGTRENPSYLPVEVCIVEPGQPAKSKLTPFQTRNMLAFAVRTPPQNAQSIVSKGTDVLGLKDPLNPTLENFGIHPDLQLVTVTGRVLSAPRVYYKDAKSNPRHIDTMGGSWNMKAIKFSRPTSMASWTWLYIDSEKTRPHFENPNALNAKLQEFAAKLNEMGVTTPAPKPGMMIKLTGNNHEGEIYRAVEELMKRHNPNLILSIMYGSDTEAYNSLKKVCDVHCGVRNINVLAEKLRGANDQYYANVGLKFNLKLGGANQSLKTSELGIVAEGKTMLVGIDVTHPSPGSSATAPSVAGMVASIDSSLSQWPADIRIQTSRQEMVSDLDAMLKARLQRWARTNKNALPENIIVYRDGVSEGQYDLVIEKELPLLKKACVEIYPPTDTKKNLPRISIVVVGKRHHTRFYPTRDEDADRSANPKNGTVVDRGVTEARNWDFFLQAHTAIKGTARPAHYFTVWDEIFARQKPAAPFQNAADVLEDLTHRICYLFGRATKAVSICPPAYYADLVCTRARCYLSSVFDPTPTATPAASEIAGSGRGGVPDSGDVQIHGNVRDTMFYI
ncbi:putative RNA interference and gene silencing protein (Qde2) [Aspergillus clavatus NRRL 1]|uniref:RNA interference and gene silencing protein (Qde2), putative n=1 Tax=Aspergillus clavatus (strain ATCC 1007 / CBS 513.65 / DSM 816 / NCTC 3887 / NRRL 1 / QM 1276 / 107) TaxID=344612 RepID=A1C469_ASPCL|nr:RNA interference and gene silencing protein (Qde2), putative [Aspergillus clavatus NRRL 1]EAW15209.1 RNA interference and gene silencing protein (Qde2), putative [Aspergillus clavatus NRRL 1]